MSKRSLNVEWYRRAARANAWLEQHGAKRVPLVREALGAARRRFFPGDDGGGDTVITTHGVTLELPGRYVRHYVEREYEPVTTRVFLEAIRPGATVVDVGAHVGYYTCLAARATGRTGAVHAIEPATENLTVIRHNVARNGFDNVHIHGVAAAAASGERTFVLTNASDSHGFYDHPLAHTVDRVVVQTQPVDDLVAGPADVIKIDAEGAELEVLEGLRGLLGRSPGATVIVEWNPPCLIAAGRAPEELPPMLRQLGLRDLVVVDDRRGGDVRPLEELEAGLAMDELPLNWYVNLSGTVA
jgi:FkbM family methyltransferase